MDMDGMGAGGMMIGMLIWGLLGLVLLALAIVATIWLIRGLTGRGEPGTSETPDDILRRRYASGELDEDEYLSRRAGLRD
ncbi:SHOCT domain-containing protein [Nocardioides sp.]|uniref:SHOCT domain-containing protein n=1 Tax=Nocardioides sp. TaxID=35761 RepID=UPI002B624506|nr:SHOCT domain-containing protein [Nocardioides sp.]HXH78748.1 SHOCT domain-containing protein [Nocardioides sp.]